MTRADEGDEARLAVYAGQLADAIDAAIVPWVLSSVARRCREAGVELDDQRRTSAEQAAEACRADVGPRIRTLLTSDLDEQRGTPLAILRSATSYPTQVLRAAGVPPVARDEFAERSFPDDVYALSPAAFSDIDPSLHEPGLIWGAAKAHVHLARRREDGQR